MRFTLIIAAVIASLFRICICDEVVGYSELANDLFAPLAATSITSPNLIRNIFSRQPQWCTAGSPYVICPTPRTCCNARDNCTPTGCCPKIAETCGGKLCTEPGAVCCGSFACKPGASCKLSARGQNVCCRSATDVACDGYCCPAGSSCAGGGLCQRGRTSISRSTSTSRSRSTSRSTSISWSITMSRSTITRTAATTTRSLATSTSTKKTTDKCTPTPGLAPRAAGGWDYIKVQGEDNCVPVLDFFCVNDLFDQMCTSMCQGIRDQRNINPQNVLSDRAILLHRRMGRNAAAACGSMGCAQRLTYSNLYKRYFSMQCDEFPPASSMEGGGPTVTCISWYQNNLGGVYLRYFYDDVGLQQDQPYVIRMDTCDFPATPVSYPRGSEPQPHPKRQANGGQSVKAADNPLWVRDPRTESEGYVLMPLESGRPGTYNGTLSLSSLENLKDVSIVDGAGGLVWNSTGAAFVNGQRSLQYNVQDDTQDLFVAAKAATSVSVSAAFTATSVPQATSTMSSAAMPSGGGYASGLLAGVAVAIMWI